MHPIAELSWLSPRSLGCLLTLGAYTFLDYSKRAGSVYANLGISDSRHDMNLKNLHQHTRNIYYRPEAIFY